MRFLLALLALMVALPSGAKATAIAAVDNNVFSLSPLYGVSAAGGIRPLAPGFGPPRYRGQLDLRIAHYV